MKRNAQFFMLAVLLAASSFAAAQVMVRQGGTSPGMLLNRKDVQDDLKLSTEVRAKIKTIWEGILKDSGAQSQGSGGFVVRGGAGGVNPAEKMTEKAVPLLTAAQKTRLEQIRIQLAGPRIAAEAAMKTKIGITADQDTKIKKLIADEQAETNKLAQAAAGHFDQSMMEKMKALHKTTDAAIDKLLTKAQKDKIKELGGAPFKAKA
jgi:hypothetical protein